MDAVWTANPSELADALGRDGKARAQRLAQAIHETRDSCLAAGESGVDELTSKGVTLLGPKWIPPRLREIRGGPLWLFVEGDPDALFSGPHIAIVGTRNASESGCLATKAVVRSLAAYPAVLVSGLAEGIDATAHAASLTDGLRNVAFLGHGTDLVFPASTSDLRRKIVDQGGAVVTEYPPNERYRKEYFVQRNRLQAGLSDLVVAVEGKSAGGTSHTVRFAAKYGRPLIGLTWPSAGDLADLVASQPKSSIVDIFSEAGRRDLDERFRSIADAYGHDTSALSLVEKQLVREARLRHVSKHDLLRLQEIIDRLSHMGGDDGTESCHL
ncbi:DNA-processing protein DprA [Actinopolymorpha singaporensis]